MLGYTMYVMYNTIVINTWAPLPPKRSPHLRPSLIPPPLPRKQQTQWLILSYPFSKMYFKNCADKYITFLLTLLQKITNIPKKKSCQFCIPQLSSLTLQQSRSKNSKYFLLSKKSHFLKILNVHAVISVSSFDPIKSIPRFCLFVL